MAGGEKAKSSGEFGEKIAARLLELIGWNSAQKNLSISCLEGEDHKKTKHGVDCYFSYESPLKDNTFEEVVISVKHNEGGYPLYPKTKFKDYLRDIAHTIECFNYDSEYRNVKAENITGVIFWFSNNPSEKSKGIIEKVWNFRHDQDISYGPIYLVDNKKAAFLVNAISYAKNRYNNESVSFVYPSTGYNDSDLYTKIHLGKILPVQYINSSVLPIRIDGEKGNILLLFINEEFSESGLKRLMGLATYLTGTWANKTIILFPDYNELRHSNIVAKVSRPFRNQEYFSNLIVDSFLQDLQSLGADNNE